MKTALYRHFDAAGTLLYVGISNDALRRLCQHKDRSGWFAQICRVDVEWLPDRASALAAEAKAIASEAPAWNVRGRRSAKPPAAPSPPSATTASGPAAHSLVGMYFHTFKENGALELQGHITAVDGDIVLAQLFEWFMGQPSNVQAFQKAFICSDRCRLYADRASWIDWADSTRSDRWRAA